jgi:hypothetical protein
MFKTENSAPSPQKQTAAIALDIARQARLAAGGNASSPRQNGSIENFVHSGPLTGSTAGRADSLPIAVPNGSHIIPADIVAAIGGGNSMAGHAKLEQMFNAVSMAPHAIGSHMGHLKSFSDGGQPETVSCMLSDGEFIVPPEMVLKIGNGDPEHGHAVLDELIIHIRKNNIKELKSLPRPAKD